MLRRIPPTDRLAAPRRLLLVARGRELAAREGREEPLSGQRLGLARSSAWECACEGWEVGGSSRGEAEGGRHSRLFLAVTVMGGSRWVVEPVRRAKLLIEREKPLRDAVIPETRQCSDQEESVVKRPSHEQLSSTLSCFPFRTTRYYWGTRLSKTRTGFQSPLKFYQTLASIQSGPADPPGANHEPPGTHVHVRTLLFPFVVSPGDALLLISTEEPKRSPAAAGSCVGTKPVSGSI